MVTETSNRELIGGVYIVVVGNREGSLVVIEHKT